MNAIGDAANPALHGKFASVNTK